MKLSEIVQRFSKIRIYGDDLEVKDLCIKAQESKEGDLFIALPGEKSHGLDWEKEAISRGVRAILSDKIGKEKVTYLVLENLRDNLSDFSFEFYGNPQKNLKIIGITGTTGKTTTAHLIHYGISLYFKAGLIGTTHYQIGKDFLPSPYTTPEAPILAKVLKSMVDKKLEYLIMEVSSHSLKQKRVDSLNFERALFTNIGRDHLDFHITLDDYIKSKFHLIDLLKKEGVLIYNYDEENFKGFKELEIKKIAFSIKKKKDISLKDFIIKPDFSEGKILVKNKEYYFKVPLIGLYNLENFLGAISCLWSLGFPLEETLNKFKYIPQVKGRFERIEGGQKFPVIVDYAHTPEGFEKVLSTIREVYNLKIIAVFGAGGDRDKGKRRLLGEVAGRLSDIVIITTDNPRSEDPVKICQELKEGVFASGQDKVLIILDREEAIKKAISMANQNFVVVLLGKGHENYQIYKDKKVPFSDFKVALKAIKELRG